MPHAMSGVLVMVTLSNEANPVHQYLKSDRYKVCLTGWSNNGCEATACEDIEVDIRIGIDVPTAFSPNGDGHNDILFVRGAGIKDFSFVLYNRWGQKIFETSDLATGWDGRYISDNLDNDVVAYTLVATFIDGSQTQKQGSITIVR